MRPLQDKGQFTPDWRICKPVFRPGAAAGGRSDGGVASVKMPPLAKGVGPGCRTARSNVDGADVEIGKSNVRRVISKTQVGPGTLALVPGVANRCDGRQRSRRVLRMVMRAPPGLLRDQDEAGRFPRHRKPGEIALQ